ncbi:MAG: DUF2946 family protein [Hydrogenophaga sp.]|nr:DUF2946 family protein [Hydrogenophaga sp.]
MHRWRASRLTLWLAVAVSLLGALAPTVSRALAVSGGRALAIEVCTSEGPRWLLAEPAEVTAAPAVTDPNAQSTVVPDRRDTGPTLDHCPFCLLVAERLGPPPAASMHFFNAESGLAPPDAQALFFFSVSTRASLPRGPPALR